MSQPATLPALDHASGAGGEKPTRFRWFVVSLLLYATAVNYIDRSILNVMYDQLEKFFQWRPYQYGLITASFTLAYGIGFLIMGWFVDRVGTRIGFAVSLVCWTLAAIGTAFTGTPFQFGIARFCLGLGEAGNYPAAIKTVAEWFPKRQRAVATGFVNAGANLGAILAPLVAAIIVPFYARYAPNSAWRAAFLVTPVFATIWIILWLTFFRDPATSKHVNKAEFDLIHEDDNRPNDTPPSGFPVELDSPSSTATATNSQFPIPNSPLTPHAPVRWRHLLPHRQTWSFIAGKITSDPAWGFFLFWSGKFFKDKFGVDLKGLALPLIYIYVLADIGSIAGGWFSSALMKRGWSTNSARKTAMWTCAFLVLPVAFAPVVPKEWPGAIWISASLIGLAVAAHQGFSSNIFTTCSDMFPKRAVSSVVGLGGVAGAIGGIITSATAGIVVEMTGNLFLMFVLVSFSYIISLTIVQCLVPKLQPVDETTLESTPMPRIVTALLSTAIGFIVGVPLSYFFQNHSLFLTSKKELAENASLALQAATNPAITVPPILHDFNFPKYISSIFSGDIFACKDHSALIPTVVASPLLFAAAFCFFGLLLHPFLFRQKP